MESDLLDEAEKVFVEAALDAVYEDAEAEIEQLGDDVEVVQYVVDDGMALGAGADPDVSLTAEDGNGGERRG